MITKGVNLKLDIEPLKWDMWFNSIKKCFFFSHCSSGIIRKDLDFELNAMHLFLVKFNTSIVEFVLCGYKKFLFLQKSHLVERFLFSIAFLSRQSFTKRSIGQVGVTVQAIFKASKRPPLAKIEMFRKHQHYQSHLKQNRLTPSTK